MGTTLWGKTLAIATFTFALAALLSSVIILVDRDSLLQASVMSRWHEVRSPNFSWLDLDWHASSIYRPLGTQKIRDQLSSGRFSLFQQFASLGISFIVDLKIISDMFQVSSLPAGDDCLYAHIIN